MDVDVKMGPGDEHFDNFIAAMRSRKIEDLNADIAEGYLSAACCQLGNVSYRLGQQVAGTTKPDVLGKHEEIAKSWDKVLETVKGAIGLDVSKGTYQLGPMLTFDPKTEKFVKQQRGQCLLDAAVSQAVRRARTSVELPPDIATIAISQGIRSQWDALALY